MPSDPLISVTMPPLVQTNLSMNPAKWWTHIFFFFLAQQYPLLSTYVPEMINISLEPHNFKDSGSGSGTDSS